MEDFVAMSNSQMLVLLEAIKIISEKSEDKKEFEKYIDRLKDEIKKPTGSLTKDPIG